MRCILYCPLKAKIFEQDDIALPRVASFFHQESEKQQAEAQAMLDYLTDRGGQYCNKDIQVKLLLTARSYRFLTAQYATVHASVLL